VGGASHRPHLVTEAEPHLRDFQTGSLVTEAFSQTGLISLKKFSKKRHARILVAAENTQVLPRKPIEVSEPKCMANFCQVKLIELFERPDFVVFSSIVWWEFSQESWLPELLHPPGAALQIAQFNCKLRKLIFLRSLILLHQLLLSWGSNQVDQFAPEVTDGDVSLLDTRGA
jgi:hypothetical protein